MTEHPELPGHIEEKLAYARRLEWWTIFFLITIVVAMYMVLGSSQAMKTAWLEDVLSLLPPILFLVSERLERRPPTARFPYGFHRIGSLAFFAAALALAGMGSFLVYEAAKTLLTGEHPTVDSVSLFGREIWLGWLMMAALLYSVIPPMILGRMKKRIAGDLKDKILYTDADTNAADWKTGLAGIAGLIGIGFGLWWADAVAAALISVSILKDGIFNCRIAMAELVDGAPRTIGGPSISEDALHVKERLEAANPGMRAELRETGRYMRAVLFPREADLPPPQLAQDLLGENAWRLIEISAALPEDRPSNASGRKTAPARGTSRQSQPDSA